VKQASKDREEFPKSLDRPRLLKYYAAYYSGVKDGASETLKDLEKSFDDLAEEIKLGSAIGISYKIIELNIQPFTRRLALLMYQDETKVGQGGVLRREIRGKCSHAGQKGRGNLAGVSRALFDRAGHAEPCAVPTDFRVLGCRQHPEVHLSHAWWSVLRSDAIQS
jgi:hypothetical protein